MEMNASPQAATATAPTSRDVRQDGSDSDELLSSDGVGSEIMRATVFIGNIPYCAKWTELKEFMSKRFGEVVFVKFAHHYVTLRFMGCAFVRFRNRKFATLAMTALLDNRVKFGGRLLRASYPRGYNYKWRAYPPPLDPVPKRDVQGEIVSSSSTFSLDEDSLTHVLSFLSPVDRMAALEVNKMWQRCGLEASKQQRCLVIKNPNSSIFGNRLPESKLSEMIAFNSKSLVNLDLSFVPSKVKKSTVETIAACCHKLERLNISGAYVSNHGITRIVEKCNKIKWMKVEGCPHITDKGFWCIFKHCKQLETLICYGNRFSSNCFKMAPKSLKELDVKNCSIKGDRTFSRSLSQYYGNGAGYQSEKGFYHLADRCHDLKTLNLNNCQVHVTQGIQKVLEKCRKIEELDMGHLTHEGTRTRNDSEVHLVKTLGAPANLTKLMIDDTNLCNEDLLHVLRRCINLKELDVSCNYSLNNLSLKELGSLPKLEILNICHLHSIDNQTLLDIVHKGQLTHLRMQGCRKVSDGLFEAMAEFCSQLEELDIAGLDKASIKTIRAFNKALADQEDRKIKIFACNNGFLNTGHSHQELGCPPNVFVHVVYRRLYTSHNRWVAEEEEENQDLLCIDGQPDAGSDEDNVKDFESDLSSEYGSDDDYKSGLIYIGSDEIDSEELYPQERGHYRKSDDDYHFDEDEDDELGNANDDDDENVNDNGAYAIVNPFVPVNHPNVPVNHPNVPVNHLNVPVNHLNVPVNHPNVPVNHPNVPVNHPNVPVNHLNVPVNHPNVPVNHPNVPAEGRGAFVGRLGHPQPNGAGIFNFNGPLNQPAMHDDFENLAPIDYSMKTKKRDSPMDNSSFSNSSDKSTNEATGQPSSSSRAGRKLKASKPEVIASDYGRAMVNDLLVLSGRASTSCEASLGSASGGAPRLSPNEPSAMSASDEPESWDAPSSLPSFIDNPQPRPQAQSDDDDLDSVKLEGSDLCGVPANFDDDGDQFVDGYYDNDYDEFMVNDDPLEQERWDRS